MDSKNREDEIDRLVSAAIYLMSCHARSHCPRLACMIRHHLMLIGRHAGASERVRDIAQKMSSAWIAIGMHDERLHAQPLVSRGPATPEKLH